MTPILARRTLAWLSRDLGVPESELLLGLPLGFVLSVIAAVMVAVFLLGGVQS